MLKYEDKLYIVSNTSGVFVYSKNARHPDQIFNRSVNPGFFTRIKAYNSSLYVSSTYGIYQSSVNSTDWVKLKTFESYDTSITDFILNDSGMYIVTNKNAVLYSSDCGRNWDSRNNGLPGFGGFSSIVLSMNNVFLGTYGDGVYYSFDSGLHWLQYNNGMGNLSIGSMELCSNTLFAGTFGSGLWMRELK